MGDQKTCLVTGGAGFIGSHLSEALLKAGYKVFCIDNLITGNEGNIGHLKHNVDFTFINYDVTKSLPIVGHIDYLFHLASPASVIDYQKYPKETALVNSIGTMHLLDAVKAYDAHFLFASTSEIYGNPSVHPQSETYWGNVNPVGLRSCYDEGKRWGEMITMLYHRQYNVNTRIIRIFNTYGPRMRPTDGRVVSNFINQALRNTDITVYGDGSQTRSFCFVSDLVDGIMRAMFMPRTDGEVYNLGNPEEYTVLDFADKIKKMTQSKSCIVHTDLPIDDPERRKPDISKAKKNLNWEPRISVQSGLEETIRYYRSIT